MIYILHLWAAEMHWGGSGSVFLFYDDSFIHFLSIWYESDPHFSYERSGSTSFSIIVSLSTFCRYDMNRIRIFSYEGSGSTSFFKIVSGSTFSWYDMNRIRFFPLKDPDPHPFFMVGSGSKIFFYGGTWIHILSCDRIRILFFLWLDFILW